METINMHEAKTHLSRLVEKAAKGEPFIIARAGKPLVKVVALDAPQPALPKQHKDPFDRLLVAQATVEGITLLTVDATLARYGGVVRRV